MSTSTTPSHSSCREAAASPAASGSGNSANRTDFKPQKAKSSELGTKWQIFDNCLLLSAALFRTDIENEVAANDDGTWSQYGKSAWRGMNSPRPET